MAARARLWLRLLLLPFFELRLALLDGHISKDCFKGGVGGVDVHVGGRERCASPITLEVAIDTGIGTANEAEVDPPQVR